MIIGIIVPPIYLVDTSGQQWQLTCDDTPAPMTVPVSGKPALASIFLNDTKTKTTWKITIIPNPPPTGFVWGQINWEPLSAFNPTYSQLLLVNSASGALYSLTIDGGALNAQVYVPACKPPISYYLSLITSEYQNAPVFLSWLAVLLQITCQINVCTNSLPDAFDIDEAVGPQLDALGELIGVGRVVQFAPVQTGGVIQVSKYPPFGFSGGGYVAGDIVTVVQSGGSGCTAKVITVNLGRPLAYLVLTNGIGYSNATNLAVTGGSGSGAMVAITTGTTGGSSPVLNDDTYRLLLRSKIAQNHWNGQAATLYSLWAQLFPGGNIAIIDNQDMSATIILSGVFDPIIQQLITNGYIVPRPQGVQYNYIFANGPFFGFDSGNQIAGFDVGNWL